MVINLEGGGWNETVEEEGGRKGMQKREKEGGWD